MAHIFIEFIITFLIIYTLYYFLIIKKCKKNRKMVPAEVNIIISIYKIDITKIDIYQMVKVVSLVTTFIISLIITVISAFFDNTIILLVFGTLLSLVLAIIFYQIIGSYYAKKAKKKNK